MRKPLFTIGFLLLAVTFGGIASPARAGWDFDHKIKHEDDGNVDHACATDFHLEIPVGASDVTEATATATQPNQSSTGTVTYSGAGAARIAKIDFTFDPCIDRGEEIDVKVKATGKGIAPTEAYWTYSTGRGGSILMAGVERDGLTGFIMRNSTASPLVGEVRFATLTTPYPIEALQFGHVPGLGAPQPINLPPGGSVPLAAMVPETYGHAVVFQVAGQGSGPDSLRGVLQYIHIASEPGVSAPGLFLLAALMLAGGAALVFARRKTLPHLG